MLAEEMVQFSVGAGRGKLGEEWGWLSVSLFAEYGIELVNGD